MQTTGTSTQADRAAYCEAWASMMVEIWLEKTKELGIHQGDLVESFMYDVREGANGEVDKIVHAFNYYGRMVDMGVGRAVPLEKVDSSNHKEKPWYTEPYWKSVKVLILKMSELYGMEFRGYITDLAGSASVKM